MKKLPIGISTFENIRQENFYYIDKTRMVKKLEDSGKYYFLSRPRRFGKSLFLDTLKSAFEGKKELFKGLYLENHWKWEETYPVIKISFGAGVLQNRTELDQTFEA
ncbi:MAG: AAA family ATPase, partial [Deltaproteobacteria bacterium]|nr:AAA family ATPase [Deltaproteobacteria bacterium]